MVTVYDISKVKLYIAPADSASPTADTHLVTGISSDGFGITPSEERTLIEGLYGPDGFNIDPSTAAEATVSLLLSSPWNDKLREYYENQTVLTITIATDDPNLGFNTKSIGFAMIRSKPEFRTDGKEEPTVEWNFIGYNYTES